MCSMPAEAAGDEPSTPEPERENQEDPWELFYRLFRAGSVGFLFASITLKLWDDDEIKLHLLNALIRLFQNMARVLGGWALQAEKTYNAYVETLH